MPPSIRFVIIPLVLLVAALIRPGGTPEISRWRHHRDRDPKTPRPGGAADRDLSVAPPGLGVSTGLVPVVAPPANLPCASGTKTRSEEHTSELQSLRHLVCRLLLEK